MPSSVALVTFTTLAIQSGHPVCRLGTALPARWRSAAPVVNLANPDESDQQSPRKVSGEERMSEVERAQQEAISLARIGPWQISAVAALEKARENALTMQAQCAADAAKRAKETEIEARERAMALKNLREPQGASGNTSGELAALNSSLRALSGPPASSELAALNSSFLIRPNSRRPTLDNLEATRPRRPTLDNLKAMVMA